MDNNINNILSVIWAVLCIICIIAVFCGAWWHLFTAGISFLLYIASRPEKKEAEE